MLNIGEIGAGGVGLSKTTAGTLLLDGVNAYTGNTNVTGGKLVVNDGTSGALTTSDVIVKSGGTIGGGGTLKSLTIQNGGHGAPGQPRLRAHRSRNGINPDAPHQRQINHQPAIANGAPGNAVPTTAYRN